MGGPDGYHTRPASVRVLHQAKTCEEESPHQPDKNWTTLVEVTLTEGKNRQIRRLCTRSKLKLRHLHRVAVGPLELGSLAEGECRYLTQEEVIHLYDLVLPLDDKPEISKGEELGTESVEE